MSEIKRKRSRKLRRAARVRDRLSRDSVLPRISVFRSLKHIYAQVIEDGTTRVSCSTHEIKDVSGDKKAQARRVGVELAKKAQELGIEKAAFDRGSCLFHGRVAELARGLSEGGLKI